MLIMSETIKNNLWSIVENSKYYSFGENPFPIFHEILSFYIFDFIIDGKSYEEIEQNNREYFNRCLDIFERTKSKCGELTEELSMLLENFSSELVKCVGKDQKLLAEIVDFFAEKYEVLYDNKSIIPYLSEDLADFIYWYAVEQDRETWVEDLALYNPYAGISLFGKKHIDTLESQIEMCRDNDFYTQEERENQIKDLKTVFYYGEEPDLNLRLIANICMLIRTTEYFENTFVHSGDPVSDDINDFTGGWVFLGIPPLESYDKVMTSDVELISTLIDKFIEAKGMYFGIFLLPKLFCYDRAFERTRRNIVCRGTLSSVIELPKDALGLCHDMVLVCLSKSTYDCGTILIDGNDYINNGKFDWPEVLDICSHSRNATIIGDYTFSQCDYCLLPSVYMGTVDNNTDNEYILNCKAKYLSFEKSRKISDEKRADHRNISAQLSHMLGTTYHKIFGAISELKYVEGMEDTYFMLHDNFEYMRRLIDRIDNDFSSQHMNLEEKSINEFLQKYCNARKNYGKNDFSVSFVTNLNDDTTFKIDDDFMKVLLDAILENANRHGFKDGYIENPQIQISASYTTVNKLPCVLISIANNGASFPKDFTIEKYIREGEFGGSSGNSGRGGFHIYQIAKRHQGYISLSNDDIWNVKVNIMIPLEYYEESEIEKFSTYEEEYM